MAESSSGIPQLDRFIGFDIDEGYTTVQNNRKKRNNSESNTNAGKGQNRGGKPIKTPKTTGANIFFNSLTLDSSPTINATATSSQTQSPSTNSCNNVPSHTQEENPAVIIIREDKK